MKIPVKDRYPGTGVDSNGFIIVLCRPCYKKAKPKTNHDGLFSWYCDNTDCYNHHHRNWNKFMNWDLY